MARRRINRPEILNNGESDDFFKIPAIELDKRTLQSVDDMLNYAKKNNLIDRGCVNIEELIKDNEELELIFEDIMEDGQILYSSKEQKYKIIINSNHHQNRQRFTMAHEYIHYQMHRDVIQKNEHTDTILYRDQTTRLNIDIMANRFASELLMPITEFREVMLSNKGNILKMAEIFGVSTLAIRYRAENLGYGYGEL